MDEASGNFFGKQLDSKLLFQDYVKDLAKEFEKEYDLISRYD